MRLVFIIFILLSILAFPNLSGAKSLGTTTVQVVLKGDALKKEKSYDFIQARFKKYNPNTNIYRRHDSVFIKIPEVIDSVSCIDLITKSGELLIAETYSTVEFSPILERIDSLLSAPGMGRLKFQLINNTTETDEPEVLYIYDTEEGAPYDNYSIKLMDILDPYPHSAIGSVSYYGRHGVERFFKDSIVKRLLPADACLLWQIVDNEYGFPTKTLYAVKKSQNNTDLYITESMIESVTLSDSDYYPESWKIINIKLKDAYHKTWEDLTAKNIGKALAIIINGKVITAPNVMDKITEGSFDISAAAKAEETKVVIATLGSSEFLDKSDAEIVSIEQEYAPIHYLIKLFKKI